MKGRLKTVLARGKLTLLAVVASLTLFTASSALGATGGNFILGVANTATATSTATGITKLTAQIANPAMHLVNTTTGTNATALKLETATSKPPMTVNSGTKVANLNADKVDNFDSQALPGLISTIDDINGYGSVYDYPSSSSWAFVGWTTTVKTNATQSLVGAAEVPLQSTEVQQLSYGLCYQPSAGGTISNFVGTNFSIGTVYTNPEPFPATATVVPGAGTWNVGFCIKNNHTDTGTVSHDYVNGWVQVVNKPPVAPVAPVATAAASEASSEADRETEPRTVSEPDKE